LILLWDTVRADRMSLYGHHRPTTPRLEAFAADAVVFDRAVAPGMWTVPSHASVFTGLPVASHGANAKWIWLDERFVTAAEHFGDAGWDTWAWSSNPYLSANSNLLQGFDTVESSWKGPFATRCAEATEAKLIARDKSCEIAPDWSPSGHVKGWPRHLTAHKDGGAVAAGALLDWVDHRDGDGPWMAYVNYLEAHHPRVPSEEARQAILEADLLEAGLATDATLHRTMAFMEGKTGFSDDELEAVRGVYDASLVDLDRVTGDLLDGLKARDALDSTIVVIVSDHGEHLGEHGLFDHRWSVWQELIGVPLILRYPQALPAGRVAEPVSTQQLFPTLCDLTAVPCPAGLPVTSLRQSPPARVFSELIQPTPRLPPIRAAYSDLDPARWRTRYHVAIEGSSKLIRHSDATKQLFDLAEDAAEAHDIAGESPERVAELLGHVKAWQGSLNRYDPGLRAPTDSPSNALTPDQDTIDQLKMLGYVADEAEEP
jgi:arylsulfatase A-like enzyme